MVCLTNVFALSQREKLQWFYGGNVSHLPELNCSFSSGFLTVTKSDVGTTFWSQNMVHAWNKIRLILEHQDAIVFECVYVTLSRLYAPWCEGQCLFLLYNLSTTRRVICRSGVTVRLCLLPFCQRGVVVFRTRHMPCAPRWHFSMSENQSSDLRLKSKDTRIFP